MRQTNHRVNCVSASRKTNAPAIKCGRCGSSSLFGHPSKAILKCRQCGKVAYLKGSIAALVARRFGQRMYDAPCGAIHLTSQV